MRFDSLAMASIGCITALLTFLVFPEISSAAGSGRVQFAGGPLGGTQLDVPVTASAAGTDTFVIDDSGDYTLHFIASADAQSGGSAGGSETTMNTTLDVEFSRPVAFENGSRANTVGAGVRNNPGWSNVGDGSGTEVIPDPDSKLEEFSVRIERGTADYRWGFANLAVDDATGLESIALEATGRARAAALQNQSRAGSNVNRQWRMNISAPTIVIIRWSFEFREFEFPAGRRGGGPQNPILPNGPETPFVFPPIPSRDWVDPPTTYGYEYALSDALVTAVVGWSPWLEGPVRVSVGAVDLGLFDGQSVVFADYATELGDLLVGGVGVSQFRVTEITPRTWSHDALAFPIQLEFDQPSTSTLSMTPIEEPAVTSVESPAGAPWALIDVTTSPNPFNPALQVTYDLPSPQSVSVEVFDLRGRLVRRLLDATVQTAGTHRLIWHGENDSGERAASGVYLVRVRAGANSTTAKVTLAQ